MKDSTLRNKILEGVFSVSSLLIIFFVWILISSIYKNNLIFPSIGKISEAFFSIFKNFSNLKVIFMSLLRVLLSVIICFAIGIIIASLYIVSKTSIALFRPIINIMRSMIK